MRNSPRLWTATVAGSCLILQPASRDPGVLGCIAQSVFTCGSWGAWCLTYRTWRWRAALHILTCKHANVRGPAESAPMLIISVCSRFLKTQTDPPTRTGGKDRVTLSQFLFFIFFFFRIYGLDLGLLPAFSQCHLKGESELITSAVPWAR